MSRQHFPRSFLTSGWFLREQEFFCVYLPAMYWFSNRYSTLNSSSVPVSDVTLTCIVWRAGLDAHGLRRRGGSGDAGCCQGCSSCCGEGQLLLLGLVGLQDVPLFNLLVEELIVLLYVVLQVWWEFVHAAEYLTSFFIKLLCADNRKGQWTYGNQTGTMCCSASTPTLSQQNTTRWFLSWLLVSLLTAGLSWSGMNSLHHFYFTEPTAKN